MPVIATALGIGSAIYGGGKALGWWGQPPKQRYYKSEDERAYEALMKTRAKEGMYSKGTQFSMLSRASGAGATALQSQQLASQGQSLFQGTRGVASREQAKVGQENLYRSLVEGSLSISDANELSKIQAQDALGRYAQAESARTNLLRTTSEQAGYQARQQGFQSMLSGLMQASGGLDKLLGFSDPVLAKSVEGVLGKAPEALQQSEIGFLRASRLKSPNPEIWDGMMRQYDPDNVLGLWK